MLGIRALVRNHVMPSPTVEQSVGAAARGRATGVIDVLRARVGDAVGGAALRDSTEGAALLRAEEVRRSGAGELARLRELADLDHLTRLPNRRVGMEAIAASLDDAARPTAVAMFDIDHFKAINDTHGHRTGDAALQAMSGVLSRVAAERGGTATRLGGEEFALVLPGRDAAAAGRAAEEVLAGVRELSIPSPDGAGTFGFTTSAGVAARTGRGSERSDDAVSDLLANADELLYAAKRGGRDQAAVERRTVA